MDFTIKESTLGVDSPIVKPNTGFFTQVGETRLRKLVDDHYENIRNSDIAFMFPVDYEDEYAKVKKHAADFFIQICGGPDYFAQTRGDPRMLARHQRFRIDERGRRIWLSSFASLLPLLEEEGIKPEYIQSFWNYLERFSTLLVNMPAPTKG
ncbi:globin [Sulfuricurvum sp.]|uniref:globin domain-containing protein n=1 Tax=Sulfuricurvum sp. TaxID=2025608 RepID=UPI0025DAD56C|nr:globin [Sulfuricurvum sp.]